MEPKTKKVLHTAECPDLSKAAKPLHLATPCPFCGSLKLTDESIWNYRLDTNPKSRQFYVECKKCKASGPLCGPSMPKGCDHGADEDNCCHAISWSCFHSLSWEAWNVRGGPPWLLSDAAREGRQKAKPTKYLDATYGAERKDHAPCPFCGSRHLRPEDWGTMVICCGNCTARGPEQDESLLEGLSPGKIPATITKAIESKAWKLWDLRHSIK